MTSRPTWYVKDASGLGVSIQPAFSDDAVAAANARLIASAPALLEALEPFAKLADEIYSRDNVFVPETANFLVPVGDLIRASAALKAAKGDA